MVTAGNRLSGARIAVTGAGTGIGRAVALRCLSEGARVAVLDIDGAAVRGVAQGGAPSSP